MVSDNALGEAIKAERAAFEVALTFDGDWFIKVSLQGECFLDLQQWLIKA